VVVEGVRVAQDDGEGAGPQAARQKHVDELLQRRVGGLGVGAVMLVVYKTMEE